MPARWIIASTPSSARFNRPSSRMLPFMNSKPRSAKHASRPAPAVHEVVEHAHLMADRQEMGHQDRSDVPCTTGDEEPHEAAVLSRAVELGDRSR